MVLEIPSISAAVLGLAWFSGDPLPPMVVVRLTTVFAGVPALITAIGIGRLAARETLRRGRNGAIAWAALVHSLAGMLLTLIAALPHTAMPTTAMSWAALVVLGAAAGAICGVGIGVVCTGATPRQVSEVLSLVTRPGVTLRQIIDSEDLGRIGAAVRQRASLMFDGLLDPAAPRPVTQHDASVAHGRVSDDDTTGDGARSTGGEEPEAAETDTVAAVIVLAAASANDHSAPPVLTGASEAPEPATDAQATAASQAPGTDAQATAASQAPAADPQAAAASAGGPARAGGPAGEPLA
jgi:hypothetical protein